VNKGLFKETIKNQINMRTIEVSVYRYDELNDNAKENVKHTLCNEYLDSYDALETLNRFADEIGIKIIDYSIDWANANRSYVKWEKTYYYHTMFIKEDLYGWLDYPLTKTWNKTKDVEECISEFLSEIEKDYWSQFEDEYVTDMCDANDYEFTVQGELI
tara:strand:- start:17 stop:493 length:477 start_codon:yes stop_codon:yes gene_type:complete